MPDLTAIDPFIDNSTTILSSLLLSTPAAVSEGVDPKTCRLLGPFALGVQALMGVIVISSLLLKRSREKPRRRWVTWSADVSKQIAGQAFVHASNVAISDLIARHKKDNPCGLYLLNIAIDTTFGVFLLFIFLRIITDRLSALQPDSFRTGFYGRPFSILVWLKQAAAYVTALILMKLVVVAIFWLIPGVFRIADWSLSWLPNASAQVLFVMLIFPIFMNLLQFYIIDNILRSKSNDSPDFEDVRTGFLSVDGDEEQDIDEDEPGGYRPYSGTGSQHSDRYSTLHDNLSPGREEESKASSPRETAHSFEDKSGTRSNRYTAEDGEDGGRTPTRTMTYPPPSFPSTSPPTTFISSATAARHSTHDDIIPFHQPEAYSRPSSLVHHPSKTNDWGSVESITSTDEKVDSPQITHTVAESIRNI